MSNSSYIHGCTFKEALCSSIVKSIVQEKDLVDDDGSVELNFPYGKVGQNPSNTQQYPTVNTTC